MLTENGVSCSDKKRKKKNKKKYPNLLVGDKVEVRSEEKGYESSWQPGSIIACKGQALQVQYNHSVCIDGSSKLIRSIQVPHFIRPSPSPLVIGENTLQYGQCVDAYRDQAWWEGVVFDNGNGSEIRLVFFPDTHHEMHVTRNNLRLTQDWDEISGHWLPPKNWLFLDLIEEFKQKWPLQVSVKQIWSEVKEKEGFKKHLKRWNSEGYGLWRKLVWEVFFEYLRLLLKHFFKETGDQAYKSPLLFSEASFDDILKPKSHLNSSKLPGGISRCVIKRRKPMWLPASNDIVPGPEFCPDSVTEFINLCNRNERPSPELRQNIRKHLLFLGWKIEFMRIKGILVFMYTSPRGESSGKLLKVCENLKSEHFDLNLEPAIEIFSCNGSNFSLKKVYKQKHKCEWGPADRRYAPKAEFCPDAIREFKLHTKTRKGRAPKRLTLNVRKHLSFLGWKIEFKRSKGAPKLRYTSPEGTSFLVLSKALQSLSVDTNTFSTRNENVEKLICGNLEGENSDPKSQALQRLSKNTNALSVPNKTKRKIVGENLNPTSKALQNLSEDNYSFSTSNQNKETIVCEDLKGKNSDPNSEPKNNEFSCKGSEISLKKTYKKRKRIWGPADCQFVPEAEFCPDAIREFKLHLDTRKKPPKSNSLILKVRKHLSFLGWKIDFMRFKGAPKLRYTSPEGKSFVTISKALENFYEDTDNSSNPYQNKEKIVPDLSEAATTVSICCQTKTKTVSHLSKTTGTLSVPCRNKAKIAPEYHPEAIEQYYFLSDVTRAKYSKAFQDPKNNEVKMKAKKHLAAIGWKFTYYARASGKGETHYVSKSGRKYDSLRSACKGCIDEGVVHELNSVSEDEIKGSNPSMLNSKSNEGEGRTISEVRKRGRKRKSSVTALDSHLIHRSVKKIEIKHLKKRKKRQSLIKSDFRKRPCLMKDRWDPEKSDDICSICHNGGELMLCDQCPSAFHTMCLGLQCVPVGEWFCPSCCCGICGKGRFVKDAKEFGDESVLNCDQCEHKYHVGCLRVGGVLKLENRHKENWFCNERCQQIFLGLQKLLGKPVPVGDENITWTLLKYSESTDCDQNVQSESDKEALAENYSKFNVALAVMHECFEPLREQKTRRDVLEDVIFSRSSELNRLNFQGFYTVLLEKNQEVVTVATVRVHGEKVAELPLIGTKVKYRQLGMCHMLIDELEKKLKELGVERLVLPAVPSVLNTWTESFRFSRMTELERFKFLKYIFLHFEGTTMCQKFLRDNPSPCFDQLDPEQTILVLSEIKDLDKRGVDSEILQEHPISSIEEIVLVSPIHESDPTSLTHETNPDDKVDIADQGPFET